MRDAHRAPWAGDGEAEDEVRVATASAPSRPEETRPVKAETGVGSTAVGRPWAAGHVGPAAEGRVGLVSAACVPWRPEETRPGRIR